MRIAKGRFRIILEPFNEFRKMLLGIVMKKVLFTDLDGSLLDHHNYDYSPALPALEQLKAEHVPCVLTTSKTAAEVLDIRDELDNAYPFIVENGAGVFWPAGSVDSHDLPENAVLQNWNKAYEFINLNGVSLNRILELTGQLKEKFGFIFQGFSEMTVQQVVDCTGLKFDQADKAKQRVFSEPLLWKDSDANLAKFKAFVEPHGLQVIKGGRFVHVMGRSNKGKALKFVKAYYEKVWQVPVSTIALGDGENDVPLLEASDFAVVVRSPANKPPKVKNLKKKITRAYGPAGWNKAVMDWLE